MPRDPFSPHPPGAGVPSLESADRTEARENLSPRHFLRRVDLLIGGFIAAILMARVIYIPNASVFQDEYVYSAPSDWSIDQRLLIERGLMPRMPNTLYLKLVSFHSLFENNYLFVGLLNTIVYIAALIPIALIADELKLSARQKTAAIFLCLVLPFSSYTKFFMPEVWYLTTFLAGQALLIRAVNRNQLGAGLMSGVLIGALYFIKPHAIFVLFASALTALALPLICARITFRSSLRICLCVLLGFACVYAGARLLESPNPVANVSGVYEGLATGVSQYFLREISSAPVELARDVGYVFLGHYSFIGLLFGLPLSVAVAALVGGRKRDAALIATCALALSHLLVLSALSIVFTVGSQEIGRIHMRYYGFVFYLLIPILLISPRILTSALQQRFVAGATLELIALAIMFHRAHVPNLRTSMAADGPDTAIYFLSQPELVLLCAPAFLGLILLGRGQRGWLPLALLFLLACSLISNVIVTKVLATTFNSTHSRGVEPAIVTGVIPRAERDRAFLVTYDRGELSSFLFFYRAAPYWTYRQTAGVLASGDIPSDALWVISMHDRVRVGPPFKEAVRFPDVVIYKREGG